jgi:hypothetical protein
MIESSKSLFLLLLFIFMAAAIGWTVVDSWGSFDVGEALSARPFGGNEEEDSPNSATSTPDATPSHSLSAEPVRHIDRYPSVRLSPNPKPLFAP